MILCIFIYFDLLVENGNTQMKTLIGLEDVRSLNMVNFSKKISISFYCIKLLMVGSFLK